MKSMIRAMMATGMVMAAAQSGTALACGGMMMLPQQNEGLPLVDVLGTRVRNGDGLKETEVTSVAYENIYQVEVCYEELLMRRPEATGLVMATVAIGADGRTASVKLKSRLPKDQAFEACIGTAVKAWAYARPKNGQQVVASTVIRFEKNIMSAPPPPLEAPEDSGFATAQAMQPVGGKVN